MNGRSLGQDASAILRALGHSADDIVFTLERDGKPVEAIVTPKRVER